jgi:2-C-methyl-D-erythritol 4-phosphate cytidylyltransferase
LTTAAVIVAGGCGSRLKASKPKQFLEIAGRPLVVHTVMRFADSPAIDDIVLVLPRLGFEDHARLMDRWLRTVKTLNMVPGGDERQESVWAGVCSLARSFDGLVMVHDGARPLVSAALIAHVVRQAERLGAVLAGVPVYETLKEVVEGGVVAGTLDRRSIYRAQTPQCFRYDILRAALERARAEQFLGTDEAALVERMGVEVHIVPGAEENIKVTTPGDLLLAEHYLSRESGR